MRMILGGVEKDLFWHAPDRRINKLNSAADISVSL